MAFVIKTDARKAKLGDILSITERPMYEGKNIHNNAEVFIWFNDSIAGSRDGALVWYGIVQQVLTRDRKIEVKIRLDQSPVNALRTSDLEDMVTRKEAKASMQNNGKPEAVLAQKVCYQRHSKIAMLTDGEYKNLCNYFLSPNKNTEEKSAVQSELDKHTVSPASPKIEYDFKKAQLSKIDPRTLRLISHDLPESAPEGMRKERWGNIRQRAGWLADTFIRQRTSAGALTCDVCEFNPASRRDAQGIEPRSLLDVHHKDPLAEGVRETTTDDFALLCPTCHRITHARLRIGT
jgi:predicted HNH restriction endonuclease